MAGALAAAFAGLAARALPGRHAAPVSATPGRAARVRPSPPPLVPAQSSVTPAAPAAPVQTQAPPVAVSGGS
jgi:hypothetical protein